MGHCSLIIKATRLCNLRCDYCHDWRSGPGNRMSFETLARLTKAALADERHDSVNFIWHGGETLMLPMRFYEQALWLQAHYQRPGQAIANELQTNATLVTAAWARFLRHHEFSVGISIDGPKQLHDEHRLTVHGTKTYDRVRHGIAVLRSHGFDPAMLMVIDQDALALGPGAIYDALVDLGVRSASLIAVKPPNDPLARPGTPTGHYVTPGEMTDFQLAMARERETRPEPRIHLREIDAIRRRLEGRRALSCTLAGDCVGAYYVVEPNGEIAHCDLFVGDPAYTFGTITEQSFEDLRSSAAAQAVRRDRGRVLREMSSCPEFEVCKGWCPHERYLSVRHNPDHRDDCCGLAGLITGLRDMSIASPATSVKLPTVPASGYPSR